MLPDFLMDELLEFRNLVYKPNPDDRIFAGVNKTSLNRILKKAAEKAGVKPITVHGLRHSHVSLLINMGFDAVSIGKRIGHKSVEITYRYAHMFPSTQKKLVECLENLNKEKEDYDVSKELRFPRKA
jgi:integrase